MSFAHNERQKLTRLLLEVGPDAPTLCERFMSFAHNERQKLTRLLLEVGPDAPTLCEGWDTRDLAAHLWIRENAPLAAAGMFLSVAQAKLEEMTLRVKARDYTELVQAWGEGPGPYSVRSVIDPAFNFTEHFIHHEDVRRGKYLVDERTLPSETEEKIVRLLRVMGVRMLKKSPVPIVLRPKGFSPIIAGKSGRITDGDSTTGSVDPTVEVRGSAGELLLWVFGRNAVHLEIRGDATPVVRSGI